MSAELVQAGGEIMTDVLTKTCNKIWRAGERPAPGTQSLIIRLPKKATYLSVRTISLITLPSKVMLKVIFNRLKPQANEEQARCSEPEETPQHILSTSGVCVKSTCSGKSCTMSSQISKKHLTGDGTQLYGPTYASTVTKQI